MKKTQKNGQGLNKHIVDRNKNLPIGTMPKHLTFLIFCLLFSQSVYSLRFPDPSPAIVFALWAAYITQIHNMTTHIPIYIQILYIRHVHSPHNYMRISIYYTSTRAPLDQIIIILYIIYAYSARARSGLLSILDTYGRTDASPAPPHRFLLRGRTRALHLKTVPNRLFGRASRAAVYYNGLATKFQNAHSWTALYRLFVCQVQV